MNSNCKSRCDWPTGESLEEVMARLGASGPVESPLEKLGYSSYANYLSRALWKKIKKRVLVRDDHTCQRCFGSASVVHHRSYSEAVLKGEDDSQLASLCEGCHHVIEFDDDGSRRTDREKDEVLATKCLRVDFPAVKVDLRRKWPVLPTRWKRMNWWQRTGWISEHEYQRIGRTWPEGEFSHDQNKLRSVLLAIRARTAESTWRDVAGGRPATEQNE
ncbi:hypothetical protein AWB78_08211 [Caballeronia calidae]|uniref:HNH endonuclease n=1 Tax=Caballeronia calidae TaxID=1777139 RepID=A0A158EIK1_9BURK|nr:hypothetical protein [Caballeronia calidae]SAL06722.1 hypothetical protein AWB78_08211 [Caballeronia calidae]